MDLPFIPLPPPLNAVLFAIAGVVCAIAAAWWLALACAIVAVADVGWALWQWYDGRRGTPSPD